MLDTMTELWLETYDVGHWLLLFFLCSFVGWFWEVALTAVKEKRFVNRGFLFGPILPIYGFGAVIVLMICLPVAHRPWLVMLVGMVAATLLELATGALMEALFHVRYWDYSPNRLNIHGYVCAMSSAVWAVFSVTMVCVIQPLIQPELMRVPEGVALGLSGAMMAFGAIDTFVAIRRALDLRALLEAMERYARELEHLRGVDDFGERVGDMVARFAQKIGVEREEVMERMAHIRASRERLGRLFSEDRITLEEATRQRFALFERALGDFAALVPDTEELREEIARIREEYDRLSAAARSRAIRRVRRTAAMLRRNPHAVSSRYGRFLADLRRRQDDDERRDE